MSPQRLICAHRGASLELPDNSRAAFEAAIAAGADAIETDVRADAYGRLVLAHDPVEPDGPPPLPLSALLELAGGRIGLDLEIKEPAIAGDLLDAVERWNGWLLMTSFSGDALRAVRRRNRSIRTGLLVEAGTAEPDAGALDDAVRAARACGADVLLVQDPLAPDAAAGAGTVRPGSAADTAGPGAVPIPLWVWTVNDETRLAQHLRDPQIEGVITDDPALALALRRRLPAPAGAAP